MDGSHDQFKLLYELAMDTGRSLNLFDMLKSSLNSYLKKLNCVTGIIYRLVPDRDSGFNSEMIFSIPYALITKNAYNEIENLVPKYFSKIDFDSFTKKLPLKCRCDEELFCHVMSLDDFGFLILIRQGSFLDNVILKNLEEINRKLGQAGTACIKVETLEESEMRYRHQEELRPEMLCETNLNGIVTYATGYALEKMGYTFDELKIGINIVDLFIHDDREKLLMNFHDALKNDNTNSHEYTLISKTGTTFPVLVYTNRLIKNKRVEGLISIIVDITILKENEKKLELYTERLEDERDKANNASKAKSEFLANMSHEIRTPMNAILGFSEALYHKLESEQHRKMVKSVLSSGNLLLSLLNDILDLSKIEAGKLDISLQPIDLSYILQEIQLLFSDKANKKGIDLSVIISEEFPALIMLDEIRIKQVIFNLVGNAIKFTHEGYVKVTVSFTHKTAVSGELIIEIADTGIGIPESQNEIIFEAFGQQAGQSNRIYGGVGLGLAISKRLVEKMNGTITVDSEVSKGSVFKVTIPFVEISNIQFIKKNNIDDVQDISFEKSSILVVDDVSSNIEMVETLLSSTEIDVSTAESGEIALEILDHLTPDLILMDIRMPGMDGFEFAERIKSISSLVHIPIIAFTASVFSTDKIDASGNFDGILLKPVSQTELFTVLSRFLRHKILNVTVTERIDNLTVNDLPPELKNQFPKFREVIENRIMPEYETIKDQLVLFRIEAFADELKKLAHSYNFKFLIDYSDKLSGELEIVDLDSLTETLKNFPRIIQKILSLQSQ